MLNKQKVKLAAYQTSDGQTIEVDEQTGAATIDSQPASDGEYQISVDSQDLILIVKDGVVADVKPKEAAPADDQQLEDNSGDQPTVEDLQAQIEQLTQELASVRAELEAANQALASSQQSLSSAEAKLQKLSEEPAGNPINLSANNTEVQKTKAQLAAERAKKRA